MNAPAAEGPEMRRQRPDRRLSGGWLARRLAVGVAALFAVGALPAVAGATGYCVAPNTSCGGTDVASMQGALDQAANTAEPDRVSLGATVYPAPNPGGYSYHQAGSPVEIIGQGAGQTILTSPAGAARRSSGRKLEATCSVRRLRGPSSDPGSPAAGPLTPVAARRVETPARSRPRRCQIHVPSAAP